MADERDNNFSLSDTENSRSHEPLPVTAADDTQSDSFFMTDIPVEKAEGDPADGQHHSGEEHRHHHTDHDGHSHESSSRSRSSRSRRESDSHRSSRGESRRKESGDGKRKDSRRHHESGSRRHSDAPRTEGVCDTSDISAAKHGDLTHENAHSDDKKKKRRLPVLARVIIIILAAVLLCAGGAFVFLQAKLSLISRYDPDSVEKTDPDDEDFETDVNAGGYDVVTPGDIDWDKDTNVMSKSGITNILLIGQDTRVPGQRGRSDTMIILTINTNDKKLKITSLMRDMYVQIPGYSDNRINAAYAFGGYDLLKETIEKNFGVAIDHFAEVDFTGFDAAVDIVGGVDIYLNAEEASQLKNWGHRTVEGMNHLDGAATAAYCRIRYIGNADYERTQRQRTVLSAIYSKLRREVSVPMIMELCNSIFPLVTTDMTNSEIINTAMSLYSMNIESLEQHRLPEDGTYTPAYINGMAVLVPDLDKSRAILREIIFGENTEDTAN